MKINYGAVLRTFIAILGSLIIILPLLLIVLGSLKSPAEAAKLDLSLPSKWMWSNYKTVFVEGRLLNGFKNSVLVTVSTVALTVGAGSMCAFFLSRRLGRWVSYLFIFFFAGMIAPPSMIPSIKLMQSLHISGEYIGLILFLAALYLPLTIFIMSGFVKTLPRELDEAATIDGAGSFYTFFRVVFPLLKPSIATVTVFISIYAWNDFANTLYIISDSSKWTLPFSVYNFVSQYGTEWQFVFADLLSVMLPMLVVYLFLQRFIIEGMTAGSVKG
ncbi:carbohydrate ABC transporter permease [Paenibacillus sp. JDR-2]|uniref:carbohydrate ABC transporter permease n=1 Tax=Paenibacillus sp. (strain JDR-2) TaxID=324057 RepID=UPI0001667A35|nr:carbohydrate ABC transporter permease [Paenibacillus sp. JDR-2]ACT02308.1 binding-protein-dependent transport systems inner membrane component [Paenibacillus sp. JDR-2]